MLSARSLILIGAGLGTLGCSQSPSEEVQLDEHSQIELVASEPHVVNPQRMVFARDSDGDLRADDGRLVLEGFDVGNTHHNFNSLVYALDNWI